MNVNFDAETHTYTVNGKVVPSVTQVLKPAYDFSAVPPDVLERKRQIGVATDRAITLWLNKELDESSIVEPWAGYFQGWLKFWSESGLTDADVAEVQPILAHPVMALAGTPDLVLRLGEWAVVDVKTANAHHPAWALQTAGYKELLNAQSERQDRVQKRFALRLRPDGTYRLDEHTDKSDWLAFLSFWNVYRWLQTHKETA